ncbi:MAG: FTR1 family iron permease [Pseudanabaenaceae cyanobacterium]
MTDALPAFLLTLREGVEAALILGMVAAVLTQGDRRDLYPALAAGSGAGVLLSGVLGWLMTLGLGAVTGWAQPLLVGTLSAIAAAVLAGVTLWMASHAQTLKGNLTAATQRALGKGSAAVFVLALTTVAREGWETVLFVSALAEGSRWLGAIAGLLAAGAMGLGLFRFGLRLNVRRFFQVLTPILLVLGAGLTVAALRQWDKAAAIAGWCWGSPDSCVLGPQLWDLTTVLPDRTGIGVWLKVLVGYRDRLFWSQALVWSGYLAIVGSFYRRQGSVTAQKP